ncbi:hypothetical protein Taro_052066 [Colocasia esculenta]|uniref:Protein XRI1 n=1 Tax=Colocasia esculenta TaxID=4460 RepID=A0A843XI95_COLES|nr:hypothetical protein [Colocasia esculenta]
MMMACDDYYSLGSQLPSLAWNLDDLGAVTGAEFGGGVEILNEHVRVVQPPETTELSTGYLEDAVAQWSDRCKRRRTLHFPHDPAEAMEDAIVEDLVQGFWNSNCHFDTFASGLNTLTENNIVTVSGDPSLSSIPRKEATTTEEHNGPKLISDQELFSSSSTSFSSSSKDALQTKPNVVHGKRTTATRPTASLSSAGFPPARHNFPLKEMEDAKIRKNKVTTRVVYPFAVVRPGGVDGGVTLKDINRRLLMRPTRPVRHPVGEFACLPYVSGYRPGLSGKAVVGITRIQTRGRGTITIIRTKG